MTKIDLRKELKPLYNPPAKAPVVVDVPPMSFLMLDGRGDPNTAPEFQAAFAALYGVAYTLKFMLKKGAATPDWSVMPLEGLWWTDDMATFSLEHKAAWRWTLMVMQPDFVTAEQVEQALALVRAKKKDLPGLDKLRFERLHEGSCAQIMHVGPYAAEAPTIETLHRFIRELGSEPRGKHHEIYLGDPRRTAPEKLKTVIRQPMR